MKNVTKRNQRAWHAGLTTPLLSATLLVCRLGAGAPADNANPGLIPINANPYGHTYVEWSERFWQRAVSIPADRNPGLGNGSCAEQQSGQVWFLLSPLSGEVFCTMPAGKALFFPAIGVENDYPCPDPTFKPAPGQSLEDFLTQGARAVVDLVSFVGVEIDGVALHDTLGQRVTSPLFYFTADPSLAASFDPCLTGAPQPVVSDGYWFMLAPLSVGEHTIHVTVVLGTSTLQVFDHITVFPGR
jgi:hypothetical protein